MTTPRPIPRYLGILVLLAAAGFAAVGFLTIRRDIENLRVISQDNTQWAASQMEIELLRFQRVAARVVIEHDFAVVQVADRAATVVDRFVDRSFYVDPVTRQPPQGSGEGKVFMDTFQLERLNDGRWFVVRSARQR